MIGLLILAREMIRGIHAAPLRSAGRIDSFSGKHGGREDEQRRREATRNEGDSVWGPHAPSRAGAGALASADFEEEMRDYEGVISSTRGLCAPRMPTMRRL
jgi:hypothetical protein